MMKYLPLLLLSCAFCLTGCPDNKIKTEYVSGKVTLDGKPLAGASLGFSPKTEGQGTPGYATTNEKGEYILQTLNGNALAGTSAGEYVVTVSKSVAGDAVSIGKSRGGANITTSQPKETLPVVYTNPTTTPLSASVKEGKNAYDFELSSNPPKK